MFHIMEKEYGVTRLLDPEGKKDLRTITVKNITFLVTLKKR